MKLSRSKKNKYTFHLIKDVYPLNNFLLRIVFYDGAIRQYDIKPMFDNLPYFNGVPAFNEIRDNEELFYKVKVEQDGHAII